MYLTKKIYYALIAILGLLLFTVLPSVSSGAMYDGTQTSKQILFFAIAGSFPLILVIQNFVTKKSTIDFNRLDVCITLLFCYLLINFYANSERSSIQLQELLYIFFFYPFLRNLTQKQQRQFIFFLMIGGCLQALHANAQIQNFIPSNHTIFKVTGSFFNPGPLSGYLIAIFPFTLANTLCERKELLLIGKRGTRFMLYKTLRQYIPQICLVAIILALPLTKSRAAFLSAGFSTIFLVANTFRTDFFIRLNTISLITKILGTLFLIFTSLYLLYLINTDSADGRLLIWKNTFTIITENFIFGAGPGSFPSKYMNIQEAFFRDHPNSQFTFNASSVKYAFSELLQFWSENGLVGICLIFMILREIFLSANSRIVTSCKAGLISIIVFSLFSYPFSIHPIIHILTLCIAFIATDSPSKTVFSVKNPFSYNAVKGIGIIIFSVVFILNLKHIFRQRASFIVMAKASSAFYAKNYQLARVYYSEAYPIQKQNPDYLLQYGKTLFMLGEIEHSIALLKIAEEIQNDVLVQLTLGECYQKNKLYNLSESSFLAAHNMVPNLLYPQYLLVKLYFEQGRKYESIKLAKKLIYKREKIESPASIEIKNELRELVLNIEGLN